MKFLLSLNYLLEFLFHKSYEKHSSDKSVSTKDCDTLIIAEDNSINAYNKAIQLAIKKYNLIYIINYY